MKKKGLSYLAHKVYTVHPMRVYNPKYQPPVTSGSRVTGCANFVNQEKPAKFN